MNNETSLFANDSFIPVTPSMAIAIGLNEAIVIQCLHFLLRQPKSGKIIDGEKWIYNSYREWREEWFPFWGEITIKRTFLSLEKSGLIVSRQIKSSDRKKYYRISHAAFANLTYERLEKAKVDSLKGGFHRIKMIRSSDQIDTVERIKMIPCIYNRDINR